MEQTVYVLGKYRSETEFTPNEFKVLQALQSKSEYITRKELMAITKIPSATLHETLTRLIVKGMICEKVVIEQKKGRPTHYFILKKTDGGN